MHSVDLTDLLIEARILLVDDSPAFRRLARIMLEKMGIGAITEAGSLGQTLDLLRGSPDGFDLILLDQHLPDGSGIEACRSLDDEAHAREVPIVIVTGDRDPEVIERAFAAGGSDFIAKPLNAAVLRARLGGVLRQHALLERTRNQERRLSQLFEAFSEGMLELAADWQVVRANRRAHQLLDAPDDSLPGRPFDQAVLAQHCDAKSLERFRNDLRVHGKADCELTWTPDHAPPRRVSLVAEALCDRSPVCSALVSLRDVTDQHQEKQQLRRLAFQDPLTGLPNRLLLLDRLEHAIARARRGGDRVTLLFLDMDNFKTINDTLGHEAGDQVLKTFAARLRQALRISDTVARLGGDEFVVLLEGGGEPADIERQVQRLRRAACRPMRIADVDWQIDASIGTAQFPGDGETPDSLLRAADCRMYQDKRTRQAADP